MSVYIKKHIMGVKVKARRKADIQGIARAFRKQFGKVKSHECLDILTLLEFSLPKMSGRKFEFYVKGYDFMGDTEAAMSPDSMQMYIREDVYDALHAGDRRARFTIAHELGHFVLHENVALARENGNSHKVYEDSEWQANCFAAELLAPLQECKKLNNEYQIMETFEVSQQCAQYRMKQLKN